MGSSTTKFYSHKVDYCIDGDDRVFMTYRTHRIASPMASSLSHFTVSPIMSTCGSNDKFSSYVDVRYGVGPRSTQISYQKVDIETNMNYGGFCPYWTHLKEPPNMSYFRRGDKFGDGNDYSFGAADDNDRGSVITSTTHLYSKIYSPTFNS